MFSVGLSRKYELIGDQNNPDVGDLYGKLVDISKDLISIGAPHKQNTYPEIQVLSVYGEANYVKDKLQLIETQLDKEVATQTLQSYATVANEGEEIRGNFSLSYIDDTIFLV